MTALAAQVLAMGQQPGGAGTLEGQPWVDKGRRSTVVIHEERLKVETEEGRNKTTLRLTDRQITEQQQQ